MKNTIQSIKGTRDFYPAEMAARHWIYENARRISSSFGYQEYDAPFLESIDLYAAKSGEELVKEQSFVFPDRGGDLITLRPELTPSLARMVAARQKAFAYPLRWWSWGPFWRYERPQKGRTREFFQWNIDLIGVDSPEADAELIAIAAGFFRQVGLTSKDVQILVNDRKLMDTKFADLCIPPETRPAVLRLVDRRDKLSHTDWLAYGREIGLNDGQLDELIGILADTDLWQQSANLSRVLELTQALGVGEYVRFAPHIIRGLLYYTGTVFEAWDTAGEFRALFGGGRYDNLVSDVGGEPLPAVGFAMGDVVINLVLQKFGCLPPGLDTSPAQVLVALFDAGSSATANSLAARLRAAGINTAVYPEPAKLGKQFRYGDRMGMRLALLQGPDEIAHEQVSIKDLRTSEQAVFDLAEIEATVAQMLARP